MQKSKKQLLIIDDEENMRHMLGAMLSKRDYTITTTASGNEGLALLKENEYDFILCDIRMPGMDGMEFLAHASKIEHGATIIMMSAYGSTNDTIKAMQLGAYDYISKPFKAEEIFIVLKKAEERERLRRENKILRRRLSVAEKGTGFGEMVGKSRVMEEMFRIAEKIAAYPTTVLITGESGTGKELVARGIHRASPRAKKEFIAVNCGGMPENLLESELFGYTKGAFTGAERGKKGLFTVANQGTLFLDEIGELPLDMQVKLLRVLQEQEVRPIGSCRNLKIDVRLIAATARNLKEEVKSGRFRQDLFYRLNVINIHIPPLRERIEDIDLLAHHFLKNFSRKMNVDINDVSPAAITLLLRHPWPGNVRELENVIERAVIMADKKIILSENLPPEFGTKQQQRRLGDYLSGLSIKKGRKIMEKNLISRALEATEGNKSQATKLLEISYPALLAKIKQYDL
jgi:two-component system response regulator AtoC